MSGDGTGAISKRIQDSVKPEQEKEMGKMDREKLTEYLNSILDLGVPSVDCIVYRDHKEVYRHMNGTSDLDRQKKVAPDQRYLMFSMTKVQTMTALLQLVEKGKLSLEDEVAKYLPSYGKVKVKKG